MRSFRRLALTASTALAATALTLIPATSAQAHSLDSSTIAVRLTEDSAEATVSVALESFDTALGTSYATATELTDAQVDAITDYIDEHLTVTGADGTTWSETYSDAVVESVEGIQSFSVDVSFDTGNVDPSSLVIDYHGIIESDASHEAVVVLTDAAGSISTPGVITASDETLTIGDAVEPGLMDMIGYGFHHVLSGADHLLFLTTLLLVAPLVVSIRGRWIPRAGFGRSLRNVIGVVTAFTIGHSLTLIAAALGWIALPSGPVEILVASSVAVAALHAIRPLIHRGEVLIAGLFGLVHGLAFAGILTDLGFDGTLSIFTLLAFNVGVELAQLATVALVFPSIYLISRTTWGTQVRTGIALVALTAAGFWVLDRTGILTSPITGLEEALINNSWAVAVILAGIAITAWLTSRTATASRPTGTTFAPERPSAMRRADKVYGLGRH
ncbi:HupE/UreJ family protein [Arthrobacter bussei]|uniref:HupE/UreJ family protein n=1 Tax=Arthrobacter bussei TaxID=2594179 RepID=A0A7X1NN56_9MICC|nr:HupE/UreJ family protein [Arthrobacter bussei]MPY09770.1 HupE/UreJ family protein [Arthrobacter bussei]